MYIFEFWGKKKKKNTQSWGMLKWNLFMYGGLWLTWKGLSNCKWTGSTTWSMADARPAAVKELSKAQWWSWVLKYLRTSPLPPTTTTSSPGAMRGAMREVWWSIEGSARLLPFSITPATSTDGTAPPSPATIPLPLLLARLSVNPRPNGCLPSTQNCWRQRGSSLLLFTTLWISWNIGDNRKFAANSSTISLG